MPGFAGITTEPLVIEDRCRRKYPKLTNLRIITTFPTKKAAQEWEAQQDDCEQHSNAEGPDNEIWYCYKFEY